jgi:hypothetical protein
MAAVIRAPAAAREIRRVAAQQPARRSARLAVWTAPAEFLVNIYTSCR